MPLPKFVEWLISRVSPGRRPAAIPQRAPLPQPKRKQKKPDEARKLILSGRASDDFVAGRLDVSEIKERFTLPARLRCFELNLAASAIETLPPQISVAHRIDLSGCAQLKSLPAGLRVGTLVLRDCVSLSALPENLEVHFLVLDGCRALQHWPETARVHTGRVSARGCISLGSVPASLGPVATLDLSGCNNITSLPEGARVTSWVDLQGTGVRRLPESMHGVRIRSRGVMVPDRVIFAPETLTAAEIIAQPNVELRRVMLDRFGLNRFLAEAGATVRDEDHDAGGNRQLVCVELPGDEPLVCVVVRCPSTARRYLIRVPPATKTCREAVAWTAGFENAADYKPVQET